MINLPFFAVVILVGMGVSALALKRNLIKMVIAMQVMGSGVNLFLISLGYREGGVAPIFTGAPSLSMVLPAPQALTLTSIVIQLAVIALMLSLIISLYESYGTLDSERRRLRG